MRSPPDGGTLAGLERAEEFLRQVSSAADIPMSDEKRWNTIMDIKESLSDYTAKDAAALFRPCVVDLLQNNQTTKNYQKMLVWLSKHLEEIPSSTGHGLSNYVYVQRICIWLILQDENENMSKMLLDMRPQGKGMVQSSLIDQVTGSTLQALISLIDQEERAAGDYLLLMELMKFIVTVCISNSDEVSEMFLESFMKSPSMPASARALLSFWTMQHDLIVPKAWIYDNIEDKENGYAITSMARSVLSFPWQAATMLQSRHPPKETSQLIDDDPLATLSSLVIFAFYFYGKKENLNVFKVSMDELGNSDAPSVETNSNIDSVSFSKLSAAIGKKITKSESASLLLYILLQGNNNVLDYLMARTDIDIIVVPILELLSDIKSISMSQVYILMIILLILSQDPAFAHNANGLILRDVPFYKARSLNNIRLDSFMVMILLQVALLNLHTIQDTYLHTNTLATLANLAPTLSDISPSTCQRILNVLEKVSERLETVSNAPEMNIRVRKKEIQLISDFITIILEVLNAIVVNNLTTNPTLVYCMLHKKECLERIQSNPEYREITSNICTVLHYFGDQIEKEISANQHGLTAEKIQDRIEVAMKQWNSELLQISTDLKFSYEEESSNAVFFIPYVRSIVYQSSSSMIHSSGK